MTIIEYFLPLIVEPTRLDADWPYRMNVAKCSLLKFTRSYLNSWCRNASQRFRIISRGDGYRLCFLLLTLMHVPGGTLMSAMRCAQILVFLRKRSPFDFGIISWTKLRQACCVTSSSVEHSGVNMVSRSFREKSASVWLWSNTSLVYLPLRSGSHCLLQHKHPKDVIQSTVAQTRSGHQSLPWTHSDQSKDKTQSKQQHPSFHSSCLFIARFNWGEVDIYVGNRCH